MTDCSCKWVLSNKYSDLGLCCHRKQPPKFLTLQMQDVGIFTQEVVKNSETQNFCVSRNR